MLTSFVICSIDSAKFDAVSHMIHQRMADAPHESIGVHDATGLCEGYTRGFAQSRGEAIVFCHDDIEILTPDFRQRLYAHLGSQDVIGVCGSSHAVGGSWSQLGPPYIFGQIAHWQADKNLFRVEIFATPARLIGGMQIMDGVLLAARRHAVEQVGFDQQTFPGFHMYDSDFTFRAHQAGFKLAVACDLQLIHYSPGKNEQAWRDGMQRFAAKHQNHLVPDPGRKFTVAQIYAKTREEALQLMTPPWWGR